METGQYRQLDLFPLGPGFTVADGLELLWEGHLDTKPSGRTWRANRAAIGKTMGHIELGMLSSVDIERHVDMRRRGLNGFRLCSPQTIRHDLQLLTLMINKLRSWKRKGVSVGGVDMRCAILPAENPLEEISRPAGQPRKRIVSGNEWSVLMEHASDRMRARAFFAVDTGLSECDLRALRVTQYDPAINCLVVGRLKTRHKISKSVAVPLTNRCQAIVLEAIRAGRPFVLDWTNHVNEWRRLRLDHGLSFQWRDLRKTFSDLIRRATGGDITKMQRGLMHASPRTTIDWYLVDDGSDLRPAIESIEEALPGRLVSVAKK